MYPQMPLELVAVPSDRTLWEPLVWWVWGEVSLLSSASPDE